jgi:hypothetical protein
MFVDPITKGFPPSVFRKHIDCMDLMEHLLSGTVIRV